MKYPRIFRSQTGDTLVEVILALAVLGLVLGGSSVLASKSYKNLQSTQERSAGQRMAQSQLEYIKTYAVTNPDQLATVPSQFCMATVGTTKIPVAATDPKCAWVDTSGVPVAAGNPGYKLVTTVQEDVGGYNIKAQVQWQDLGGKSDSNELTYRIYKKVGADSAAGTGGCTTAGFMPNPVVGATPPCVPIPPQIQVVAKKIPATGNVTPLCTAAATSNLGGTSVRLRKIGSNPEPDRNQTTSSASSSTLFDNLTSNGTYETSITGIYDPPGYGRYELCPSPSLPQVVDTSTLTSSTVFPKVVNVKIRSVCEPETLRGADTPIYGAPYWHDTDPQYNYWWGLGARRSDMDGFRPNTGGDYVSGGFYYDWYAVKSNDPKTAWYNVWEWVLYSSFAYWGHHHYHTGDIIGWQPTYYTVNRCP